MYEKNNSHLFSTILIITLTWSLCIFTASADGVGKVKYRGESIIGTNKIQSNYNKGIKVSIPAFGRVTGKNNGKPLYPVSKTTGTDVQKNGLRVTGINKREGSAGKVQGKIIQSRTNNANTTKNKPDTKFSPYKLCIAIAGHETAFCSNEHIGPRLYNNCTSIMSWRNGKRYIRKFATKTDSIKACAKLWNDHYGGMPTMKQAIRYSGNDKAADWLKNVTYFYINLEKFENKLKL